MTHVTDEQLGKLARQQADLFRRVREGSLDPGYEPGGLTVAPESEQLASRVRGQFVITPTSMRLHLSPNQQNGKIIKGTELAKELAHELVLPAKVLDYYLAHPESIPERLKRNYYHTFFWGTLYCSLGGGLYVRFMYDVKDRFRSGYVWLGDEFENYAPAAVRAS